MQPSQQQQLQSHQKQQNKRVINQYAEPIRTTGSIVNQRASLPTSMHLQANETIPNIPEPDYSLSESDDDDENSVLVAHNTKMNEHIAVPVETSGNSNTR